MEILKSLNQIAQGDSGGALTVDGVLAGLVSRGGSDICAKVTSSFFHILVQLFVLL